VAVFVAVLIVVFHRAIFFGEVMAPLDLLTKELPWRAILSSNAPIQNPTQADVVTVFYPWKHFVHEELQAGRFPLWCSRVGCGYPLVGEGIIKLFGLTTVFLWAFPPAVASVLTFFTQLLVAMTGMYALLCAMRRRWMTAVLGALAYGLNSAMFQHLEFEHMTGGLMMLPWMCWALWRGVEEETKRYRWCGLAGLFWGLAILNGSIQSGAIVGVSAGVFALAILWRNCRPRFFSTSFKMLAILGILGILIAGISLVPNLELLQLNDRARFNQVDWWELTWKRPVALLPWLAALINPDSIGNYQTFDMMRVLGKIGTAATSPGMTDLRVYCGLPLLALAFLGLRKRGNARLAGLALVIAPLIAVVLTPLYLILYFRCLAATACGLAVLAALGLERFWDADPLLRIDLKRIAAGLAVAVVAVLCAGGWVQARQAKLTARVEKFSNSGTSFYKVDTEWQQQKVRATVQNFTLHGRAVVRFAAVALLTILAIISCRKTVVLATVFLLLNTADLVEWAWHTTPSVSAAYDYPPAPSLAFLQKQTGLFRAASAWQADQEFPTARPNLLLPYGLDDPRAYESLVPANPLLKAGDWSALNVRFFIVPPGHPSPTGQWQPAYQGEVDIYENSAVEPRVYFTTALETPPARDDSVRVTSYVSGDVRVTVNAPQDGWVVIGERSYPGWRARVKGQPAFIKLARGLWQAVPVRAGQNDVTLRFRPASLCWGALLSIAGLTGVVWLSMATRRKP